MEVEERTRTTQGSWLKVFLSNVRVLSDEEIAGLPEDRRRSVQEAGAPGVWVEVLCPEGACVTSDARVTVPSPGLAAKKGRWLELFCPEDQCLFTSYTDAP